jgi:hypothetical protein
MSRRWYMALTGFRSNYSTLRLYLWYGGTKSTSHLTQPSVCPSPYQTEHSNKVWSTQPGLGALILQLHFVILVRGLLFLWATWCFPCPFHLSVCKVPLPSKMESPLSLLPLRRCSTPGHVVPSPLTVSCQFDVSVTLSHKGQSWLPY